MRLAAYRKQRRFHLHVGRVDIVVGREWYWLGCERVGGRFLIGIGFGRVIA